jgi:hypothetical protein
MNILNTGQRCHGLKLGVYIYMTVDNKNMFQVPSVLLIILYLRINLSKTCNDVTLLVIKCHLLQ